LGDIIIDNMVDVQFEEDGQFNSSGSFQSRQIFGVPATPGMVRLLGKFGIRNEKVAGYILITITIVAFAVSIFIFTKLFTRGSSQNIIPPGEFTRPL